MNWMRTQGEGIHNMYLSILATLYLYHDIHSQLVVQQLYRHLQAQVGWKMSPAICKVLKSTTATDASTTSAGVVFILPPQLVLIGYAVTKLQYIYLKHNTGIEPMKVNKTT